MELPSMEDLITLRREQPQDPLCSCCATTSLEVPLLIVGTMMENTSVRLLVILSSVRMELRNGIPDSLEEFIDEINAEFMRVTTVPLETKFLAQLDKHTSKLLEVIRSKGGRVKEQTKATLQVLDETVDITIRRECIFKSLMIYLGEPVHHLIKEDMQENEDTMAIVSGTEDIQIFIDGTEVLREVPTIVTAVAMFFGLTYALNIKYPKKLQYTLEFVQRVLMELGGKKMSP
ncbi:unnamed protein product [Pleuronectes platessa]|uniref:Uncharacterized protein n=1 Tax=Pleuronectes platessa TaxID=8262 RepID=A0A9N7TPA3_PLEPL|nr:unnamed protein product [Pleuronectes platessa]